MNPLESYRQTYTYDTGNNLTCLSHQAKSSAWQQNISIHPNNNRGTETKPSTTDFDANGNLLTLNNIATLDWHYNNTLNKLTKDDKNTSTEYYVYDYQGNRVRTALESNQQNQSQRDYLPLIDILTNGNQQTNTLHIGTHILIETTKDTYQTRYQLSSHLQSNTLELNDKAEVISYEHFYPYGGTALIAGKDQTQVQQKRYRYTGKERDDSSGLFYYGARYLAPWMARWISPDSAGAVDGLNLYVYVRNNPLKYTDPTGHAPTEIPIISWDSFTSTSNAHMETNELNFWIGENHIGIKGKELLLNLDRFITHDRNIVIEGVNAYAGKRPVPLDFQSLDQEYFNNESLGMEHGDNMTLVHSSSAVYRLTEHRKGYYIGRNNWGNVDLEKETLKTEGMQRSSDFLVGAIHLLSHGLTDVGKKYSFDKKSMPIYWNFSPDSSVAMVSREMLSYFKVNPLETVRGSMKESEYGMWVLGADGSVENAFLALGQQHVMKGIFGNLPEKIPRNLSDLKDPEPVASSFIF